jgi:hypothetical protein
MASMSRLRRAALALLGLLAGDAVAADVDLAKSTPVRSYESVGAWHGKHLSQVLEVDDIARIVLLKAVTSAPATLDMANLRRMLTDAAGMPLQAPSMQALLQLGSTESIWEAVLLMRSGEVFGLVVAAAASERALLEKRGCLTAASGERACFDIPAPARE